MCLMDLIDVTLYHELNVVRLHSAVLQNHRAPPLIIPEVPIWKWVFYFALNLRHRHFNFSLLVDRRLLTRLQRIWLPSLRISMRAFVHICLLERFVIDKLSQQHFLQPLSIIILLNILLLFLILFILFFIFHIKIEFIFYTLMQLFRIIAKT